VSTTRIVSRVRSSISTLLRWPRPGTASCMPNARLTATRTERVAVSREIAGAAKGGRARAPARVRSLTAPVNGGRARRIDRAFFRLAPADARSRSPIRSAVETRESVGAAGGSRSSGDERAIAMRRAARRQRARAPLQAHARARVALRLCSAPHQQGPSAGNSASRARLRGC
jgi:hypothetical protein